MMNALFSTGGCLCAVLDGVLRTRVVPSRCRAAR